MVLNPRLLLIEDDGDRIAVFSKWMENTEFVLLVARSAGQALGLLRRDGVSVIAGVLLDHDLTESTITDRDKSMSTSDVLPMLASRLRRTVPILIHSHNQSKPIEMQRFLEVSGFSVTRIRFAALDAYRFCDWLDEVRDCLDL